MKDEWGNYPRIRWTYEPPPPSRRLRLARILGIGCACTVVVMLYLCAASLIFLMLE